MQQDSESGDEDVACYTSALQHTLRGGREHEKSEHEVRGGFQKEQGKMFSSIGIGVAGDVVDETAKCRQDLLMANSSN